MDTIRPATPADLAQVYEIWYASEIDGEPDPPPRGDVADFRHELETGEMLVAERDGNIIGFAATLTRGPITYLAELFVAKEHQSSGVGQRLLQQVLPNDGRAICTLSSRDPRALALYIRAGMQPLWPHLWLRAQTKALRQLSSSAVGLVEGQAVDRLMMEWDQRICGRDRSPDFPFWVQERQATPLWFWRDGQRVGYGFAHRRSLDSLWSPDAISLGPIGALTAQDARDCVLAGAQWARQQTKVIRLAIPGQHPTLPALLNAGFKITYVETFLSSSSQSLFDPSRYVTSGSLGL